MTDLFDTNAGGDRSKNGPFALAQGAKDEAYIKYFCEEILKIITTSSDVNVPPTPVIPTLVRVIRQSSRETVAQLHRDLDEWRGISERLQSLVQSPFFSDDAGAVLNKLDRAQAQATRVIGALEAWQSPDFDPPKVATTESTNDSPREHSAISPSASEPSVRQKNEVLEETDSEASIRDRAVALYREAEQCREQNDLAAAEDFYTQVLQVDPSFRSAYLRRGRIRLLDNRASEAVDDFSHALQLHSEGVTAYWWRGDAYAVTGSYEQAIVDYTAALKLRPDLFIVRYNRAVALQKCGRVDESLGELDLLVQIKPDFAPLYISRGLIHLSRGEASRAAIEFQTALVHQPDSQTAKDRLQTTQALLQQQIQKPSETLSPADEISLAPPKQPVSRSPLAGPIARETLQALVEETQSDKPKLAETSADDAPAVSAGERSPAQTAKPTATFLKGPNDSHSGRSTSSLNYLAVRCPACGEAGKVRWDKLQSGKVLGCPHCRAHFTSQAGGRLVEVIQDKSGRWKEHGRKQAEDRFARSKRNYLMAGVLSIALLAAGLLGTGKIWRNLLKAESHEMPRELLPRAELFARAWLKHDFFLMRQMTDPVQDRKLFNWCKWNPPPLASDSEAATNGVQIRAEILTGDPSTTWVRIHFENLPAGPSREPIELELAWQEREGAWVFKPDPAHKVEPPRG